MVKKYIGSSIAANYFRGIVPNGISVFTKDGFEHKFVVNNVEK